MQLINGVRSIVSLRSRADGRVRDAITPGTVHPKPMSIGTILLPLRPIFLRALSVTKATLAIYPVSSKRERKKNRTTIIGRKERTLPTPVKIPSIIREWITSPVSSRKDRWRDVYEESNESVGNDIEMS